MMYTTLHTDIYYYKRTTIKLPLKWNKRATVAAASSTTTTRANIVLGRKLKKEEKNVKRVKWSKNIWRSIRSEKSRLTWCCWAWSSPLYDLSVGRAYYCETCCSFASYNIRHREWKSTTSSIWVCARGKKRNNKNKSYTIWFYLVCVLVWCVRRRSEIVCRQEILCRTTNFAVPSVDSGLRGPWGCDRELRDHREDRPRPEADWRTSRTRFLFELNRYYFVRRPRVVPTSM